MRFLTKEWYVLCQQTSLHFGKRVHSGAETFDEALYTRLYKRKEEEHVTMQNEAYDVDPRFMLQSEGATMIPLSKWIEGEEIREEDVMVYQMSPEEKASIEVSIASYDVRPPFDQENCKREFHDIQEYLTEEAKRQLPSELLEQIADPRIYALGYCTRKVKRWLKTYSKLNEREMKRVLETYMEAQQAEDIPHRIRSRFSLPLLRISSLSLEQQLIYGDAMLLWESERVTGVSIGADTYEADEVIVCAGAWATPLLEPLRIRFEMHYQKAQIVHLQVPQTKNTGEWPVVMPPSTQYVLAFEDGRIVIGATHENDPDGYDTRITAGGVQEILNKGLEVAGSLQEAELLEVRVGFRPFTPGFLPVLGRVPGWGSLFVANGLGASGLTMGPWIGTQLAKLALDLEPDMPLEEYEVSQVIKAFDGQ